MGMFRSSHTKTVYVDKIIPDPRNPDPKNFFIKNVKVINKMTIVEVEYPNCKNMEGKKILVFDKDMAMVLYSIKELDPHFDGKNGIIARFIPTLDGYKMAEFLCQNLPLNKLIPRKDPGPRSSADQAKQIVECILNKNNVPMG